MHKISQDPDLAPPYPPRRGKSRQADGQPRNGVYLATYSATERKTYVRNGNVLGNFRYPRITRQFHSPLLNDYNQHLCGGWHWQYRENGTLRLPFESAADICLERIKTGLKPMASWIGWEDENETVSDWRRQIEAAGLPCHLTRDGRQLLFTVCRQGVLGEMFNLEHLAADYLAFDRTGCTTFFAHPAEFSHAIKKLAKDRLEDHLAFDLQNPSSAMDFVLTGLFLGYPAENTFALLLGC